MPFDEGATVERTKRKDADSRTASVRERAPRRLLLLLLLLLLLIGSRMMQALLSETVLLSRSGGVTGGGGAGDGVGSGGGGSGGAGGSGGSGFGGGARRQAGDHSGATTDGVFAALELLRRSRRKYVIVDAKHGLGNRLRALASAMSVAAALQRPVMLVWVRAAMHHAVHAPRSMPCTPRTCMHPHAHACACHAHTYTHTTHVPRTRPTQCSRRATCTATAPHMPRTSPLTLARTLARTLTR